MASDLSSGCTETIDIDEKEEGEISLEDVSSSEEGGIGHLTCGYVVKSRRQCSSCKSTWGECPSWCTTSFKMYRSKSQTRRDPVKGKENRHHVNEADASTTRHVTSTLQEKNDDLVPISSDSDMEIVGLTDTSKQLVTRSKARIKKKKKKKKDYEYLTVDDLISPSSADLSITECFGSLKNESRDTSAVKGTSVSRRHYRESSPFRRSGRSSRMVPRSPLRRHRSPVRTRSPPCRLSRSPLSRSRSPPLKRSLRRFRSPKRSGSSYDSPLRTESMRKPSKLDASPPLSARSYNNDRHSDVTRLLKKVKRLDSVGAHMLKPGVSTNKEHQQSSLKEKLCNMLKKMPDDNDNMIHGLKEKSSVQIVTLNDADDEDDLALLRQKALETKQKNKSNRAEHPAEAESDRMLMGSSRTNDDQDEEDLELRMIALRSAVMKKHQNRIQRGISAKNKKKQLSSRCESPFTQSFLENIPIPGDELLKFASPPNTPSSPCTPPLPLSTDSNHIEDMELDTDVEREKEKLPYSPTDKITIDVPIDTEMLGIEPSDVSFINLNDTNNSPIFVPSNDGRKPSSTDVASLSCNGYLSPYMPSPKQFADSPASCSDDEGFHANLNDGQRKLFRYLRGLDSNNVECDLIDGICCQQVAEKSIECVYSDVVLPTVPVTSESMTTHASTHHVHVSPQAQDVTEPSSSDVLANMASTSMTLSNKCPCETASSLVNTYFPTVSASDVVSSSESTVAVNDLHKMENEGTHLSTATDRNLPLNVDNNSLLNVDNVSSEKHCRANTTKEPLYMQGVPDISKDINKIPTLINKTLVPATILKSNKQLQQPLPSPVKKPEVQPEPTFKNAEMQPVVVTVDTSAKSSTTFKPIKLVAPAKKCRKSMLTTPVAFNDSASENLEDDTSGNESQKTVESRRSVSDRPTSNKDAAAARKRRKRGKRNKNLDSAQNESDSCTSDNIKKDVDTNTIKFISQSRATDTHDSKSDNDNNKAQENVADRESSLKVAAVTQGLTLQNDSSNIRTENAGSSKENDPYISSKSDMEEQLKQAAPLTSRKCPQQKNDDASCLPANSDAIAFDGVTKAKDAKNRRQSMDEDENELRAIVLASLTKRSAKLLDTNGISTTVLVTTNTQMSPQKTPTNIATNNQTSLLLTSNSPRVDENVNTTVKTTIINNIVIPSTSNENKKRLNTVIASIKGPAKKVLKKAPVSASTRVVNNAKKYQNTIGQRKNLNLQKHDVKLAHQDNVWPLSGSLLKKSSTVYSNETQRIVINLGSDTDSNSEAEAELQFESERCRAKASGVPSIAICTEPNTDFEKSLNKFLRDVRKEHESATACKFTSPLQTTRTEMPPVTQADLDKDSSNVHTPLAVRHLPASQQAEYRRLKQQILVREKMKLQRKVVNNNNSNNNSSNIGNNLLNNEVNASSLFDKEDSFVGQNQIKLKEEELQRKEASQQSQTDVQVKNADATKSAFTLNPSRTIVNKNISVSANAKQTNSVQLQAKATKKAIPNLSIQISNKISPSQAVVESRTIENSIDFANKRQLMNDKQQFRPALRTLSKDEINRKYVQIQLKQDTTERVVIINDKSNLWHEMVDNQNDQSEKPIESINAIVDSTSEKTISRIDSTNSELSSASTVILSTSPNLSKQELSDSMETTISRSQYECERENNCNVSASLSSLDSCNHSDNNISLKFNMNVSNTTSTDSVWDVLKKDVRAELEALTCLPKTEQQRYLTDTEHKLVAKRYTVLDHLAEMSGDLRQWDMEKDLQNSLAVEVKKLKEQLKIAEERLEQQRHRVSSMNPKISSARQKINAGRRECFKLSKICSVLGNRFLGKDYKLPKAGDQLLSDKLKEIANHTRQLSKKKLQSNEATEISIFSTSSLQKSTLSQLSMTTCSEDVLSQVQLNTNDEITRDATGSKDNIYSAEQFNITGDLLTLDTSQMFPNQVTPLRRNQTSAIVVKSYGDEPHTPDQDKLFSDPKLSSTPISIEQNSECIQRTHRMEIPKPVAPSESGPSTIDSSPCQDNEQESINETQLSPSSLPTTTTTTTTTMTMRTTVTMTMTMTTTTTTTMTTTITTTMTTTTTTIEPYVSILTHLKTPWNADPNGILCPYDLMGICNDTDCQFLHQSTNST